jgi:hypothetical protein
MGQLKMDSLQEYLHYEPTTTTTTTTIPRW